MGLIDFDKALNAEQRAAVLAPAGPLLVLAAAGTGKTRTLVYRVARLVEQGVEPRRILLLTFTNKAAREMLERAGRLVGGVSALWSGTFHHMANRMLRRHADRMGYALDYTILDRDDSEALLRDCVSELKLKDKLFPKPEVLASLLSSALNRAAPVQEVVESRFVNHPVDARDVVRVLDLYAGKKRRANAMDFDDLLVNGLRLFQEHPDVLARFQEQFLNVLVDEYQDTNVLQARWVDLIAARHRNLLVVGDDFQSIYSWRGADYRNLLTFPQRYPDALMFKLETNYRSVPEILEVANRCIAGNPEQFQKTLRASRAEHHKPVLAVLRDGEHQARYVTERIGQLRREGYPPREIAVLYRAHHHAMELQLALTREHIPHVVLSGVRFFEQAHVKDACSLLRLIQNPEDVLAFKRLLTLFPGVGPRTAEKLWTRLGGKFHALDPASRKALAAQLSGDARDLWAGVEEILDAYAKDDLEHDPGEVITRFMAGFYEAYALDSFEDYARRLDDLRELAMFTAGFETNEAFLSEMALMTNLEAESDLAGQASDDQVRLTTVHQAKGLEWRVVFILWLADGMFPSSRAMGENGGEAEERRLFYVAVTRAKDELYLCCPKVRRAPDGSANFLSPSRFVCEVPANFFQHEQTGIL